MNVGSMRSFSSQIWVNTCVCCLVVMDMRVPTTATDGHRLRHLSVIQNHPYSIKHVPGVTIQNDHQVTYRNIKIMHFVFLQRSWVFPLYFQES